MRTSMRLIQMYSLGDYTGYLRFPVSDYKMANLALAEGKQIEITKCSATYLKRAIVDGYYQRVTR